MYYLVSLLVVVLGLAACVQFGTDLAPAVDAAASAVGDAASRSQASQERYQYYRGIYDICAAQLSSEGIEGYYFRCNEAVKALADAGWYEQPSEGYESP